MEGQLEAWPVTLPELYCSCGALCTVSPTRWLVTHHSTHVMSLAPLVSLAVPPKKLYPGMGCSNNSLASRLKWSLLTP